MRSKVLAFLNSMKYEQFSGQKIWVEAIDRISNRTIELYTWILWKQQDKLEEMPQPNRCTLQTYNTSIEFVCQTWTDNSSFYFG